MFYPAINLGFLRDFLPISALVQSIFNNTLGLVSTRKNPYNINVGKEQIFQIL